MEIKITKMEKFKYFALILLSIYTLLGCTNEEETVSSQAMDDNNALTATAEMDLPHEERTGSYQTMDYGPVLTESVEMNRPEESLVRKGLAIRLAHDAAMIFDSDLVGFAAGVKGGWLDISETAHASYKASDIAKVEGQQVFESSDQLAGWAKDGSFDARRTVEGFGPLPDDWAHYKGYYKHGDKVLLSYSVGETDVRELPEAVEYEESLAFTRTIQTAATDQPMEALLLKNRDDWSVDPVSNSRIILDTGTSAIAVTLANAPEGVTLNEREDGLVTLQIPPSDGEQTVRVAIMDLNSPDDGFVQNFTEHISNIQLPDIEAIMEGGPSQWAEEIQTSGELSDDQSGYVIDRIGLPDDNPWGAWMRLSGIDFFDDGDRAAVSTWNGDVWIISGFDEGLDNIQWKRFASGMFYPMGVAVVDGTIYVTERSQLTRLHDLNGDREADYYENFNNDGVVYPMAHTLQLAVDSEGYFYFFKNGNRVPGDFPQHGALIRVSPDGLEHEVYGTGFRSANSLGIGPDDNILTADQQGDWVPAERINMVREKGEFYGYRPHGGEGLPVGEFNTPVAWIPHEANNSAGFITYVDDSRWGPWADHWIMGSYGRRTLFAVLLEEMGDKFQGGVVQLPGIQTESGPQRAQVNPGDGQLYVAGLGGWSGSATVDGSFERIRYAGGNVSPPTTLQVTPKGVELTFSGPLDPASATDIERYDVQRWEYAYTEEYGSPDMSLANPLQEGRDSVTISSVTLSNDGQTVFLEIPNMKPAMQMEITYNLEFADGQQATNTIYNTVNWLSAADADNKPVWQQEILAGKWDSYSRPEDSRGQRLISQAECRTCHTLNEKSVVGPSFMEISQKYEQDQETVDQLVNKVIKGGSGNWGELVMPPHPNTTPEEAEKMVEYILELSEDDVQ